ncbi:cytochrome p450 [Klebsormidium nitens]|uniref:Cytochrome p450 n=1 Tax=Klebsormidium nitens TaxID=105231 RepID=A0A1Y1I0P6_KLENI|nr:cytochrome p450 [Klebsormidium nitens]|eukprot:GAQ84494.1 cytochrome p450 [Klebsormidium nitens]
MMFHSSEDYAETMWAGHSFQLFAHHPFSARLILAILSVALIIWCLNKTLLQPYLIYLNLKRQGVKGAPFRPFIGQLPEIREHMRRKESDPQYAAVLFVQSREQIKQYGDIHISQMGPNIDLVLTSPDAIKEVLVTKAGCFEKPAYVKNLLSLMGNGLVFAEGPLWERQRRMINPAFNHKEIKAMSEIMIKCTNEAADRWCQTIQGGTQELEMLLEFSKLTLDVIGRAAFGSEDVASGKAADELYGGLSKLIEDKVAGIMEGWSLIPGYELLPTSENRKAKRREKELRALGMRLIKSRRETRGRAAEKPRDLLGMMLVGQDEQGESVMSDEQLLDECMTFLLAGHETTAVLLTWTVYLLTSHPEYVEKARAEINDVLGGRADISFEDLPRLKLLQGILYESLRLYPPVPMMGRTVVRDTEIAGIRLQKGTEVTIVSYPMHVREALWGNDVMEFRPERFANGISGAVKQPGAFLPFSAGPRTCIGQNFAMTEAKIVLVKLLRTFSLKLAPGYRHFPVMYITMKPKHGLPVVLESLFK